MKTIVGENTILGTDQISYEQRQRDLEEQDQKKADAKERAKKNDNFIMMYRGQSKGTEQMMELIKKNPHAALLFTYLFDQMDRSNALVASGRALADALGISEPSVSRATKYLVENGYIDRFKSGGSSVYVANPEYVWAAWADGKSTCLFNNSKVLISKNEQDKVMTKRFNVVMEKRREDEEQALQEKRQRGRPRKSEEIPEFSAEELEARGQHRLLP